jgi:hypothetical protein
VWKQFDPEATRADFRHMRELGVNCVRVFLTLGSFFLEPDRLSPEALAKFDRFLTLAEEAGIYVHPTGPDHWEGLPDWAKGDRYAAEPYLKALEVFWSQFAARYRARPVIFAYDLLNEPEVPWSTPTMRDRWTRWVIGRYGSVSAARKTWAATDAASAGETPDAPEPPAQDAPGSRWLLDYQRFREGLADTWTRRQVSAIRSADPGALVTVGLIQWSVPALLAHPGHYSAFRPERQAQLLDFLEVHFYPLADGFYDYRDAEGERRNLAYLHAVVAEVAQAGKAVVIGEFGWHGGGQLTIDNGRHPPATEAAQSQWCRRVVETSAGLCVGWLNWGWRDQPEATDVSQLTGLLTGEGRTKAWGRTFQELTRGTPPAGPRLPALNSRPRLDWDACVVSSRAGASFRDEYGRWFRPEWNPPSGSGR